MLIWRIIIKHSLPIIALVSHRSRTSSNSTSSSIRRKNLELQRLEEERQLAKERDTEFLNQKYTLLRQTEEEADDSSSQDLNSVHEWLGAQTNPTNLLESNPHPVTTVNANMQNCPTENQNSTFTTSILNQRQVPTLTSLNNNINNSIPINHTYFNFQDKTQNALLASTSYNNASTFINMTPQTTTATQPYKTLPASANYTFRPSISSVPYNNTAANLNHHQINSRQTVPKDLPIFSGNPEEWPLFSSTYDWSTAV